MRFVSVILRTIKEDNSFLYTSILATSSEVSLVAILIPFMFKHPLGTSFIFKFTKLFHSVNF